MSIVGSDPLAVLAIESGLIRAPLADAAAEGASKLDTEQLAAVLGEPVPIVFCRRDEAAGTGGVLVSPPATEARFSNDASNAVTASYHLVLSEGRIGSIQVRDVFQRSCRVGTFSQTYDRRAGTWAPGNFVALQTGYDLPDCPFYCGNVGTYDGISTLSFTNTVPDGFDFWNRQVHAFIRNGMQVVRLVDGVIGSSNNFMDLALWAMTNCAKLQESQIDMASLRAAAQFLSVNQLNCDIRITESGNLGDFLARHAPYFLLAETRLNGKRGFRPLLPTNGNGTIKTTAVSWRCVLTEAEILPDGFEISYVPVADRKPFCVQAIWRQQLTDDFGIIRTSEVRYADEAAAGPFEQHDLSAFATREDHAVKVGAYIRARRKWVGHTARIRCRPMELPEGLAPGDLLRVTLQRVPSNTTASTHDLLYQIDTISPMGDAIELGATHFPVDAQGASLVALEVVSAAGTGILLTSNRTGISCDINSSSDTSVPAEAFTEAEAIDDQVIMESPDTTNGASGTGWSTYTYGYTQPPPKSFRGPNGGLYFHKIEWRGPYLAVVMRIDPVGRAPQPLTTPALVEGAEPEPPYGGDLIASIESGLVVAVDASGNAISPQPSSLPALSVTGLVAHPWLSEYYPEAEFQAQPDPEEVFEAVFLVPFKDSDFPSDPGIMYKMPIAIKSTQGGFSEVAILNQAVAIFEYFSSVPRSLGTISLSIAGGAGTSGSGGRVAGLHFDGNLTDTQGGSWAATSGVTFITSGQKFGSGAANIPAGERIYPTSLAWPSSTYGRDFVYRGWIKISDSDEAHYLFGPANYYSGGVPGFLAFIQVASPIAYLSWEFQFYNPGSYYYEEFGSFPINQWVFVEIGRVDGEIRGSVDGVVSLNTLPMDPTFSWQNNSYLIGDCGGAFIQIDDFEIAIDQGPRTTNFTPPIAPFS